MKHFFAYHTLLSVSLTFSASTEITEHSPLLARKKTPVMNHKIVLKEIGIMADRMHEERKKPDELKEEFSSQEIFAITKAYISSDCPREELLRLYAQFLKDDKGSSYTSAIDKLLSSADKCALCQ